MDWKSWARFSAIEIQACRSSSSCTSYQISRSLFQVECDAFNVGIGDVLMQEGTPVQLLTLVQSSVMQRWSRKTYYDKELYAVVQALRLWDHFLIGAEFVLYSDPEALRLLKGQKIEAEFKTCRVSYSEKFSFVLQQTKMFGMSKGQRKCPKNWFVSAPTNSKCALGGPLDGLCF